MRILRALLSTLGARGVAAGSIALVLAVALAWAAWRARIRRKDWLRAQAEVLEARAAREAAKYTAEHAAALVKLEMAREREWASAHSMDEANDTASALAAAVAKVAPEVKAVTDSWLHPKVEK